MNHRVNGFTKIAPLSNLKNWVVEKKQKRDISKWERNGRPAPPPHEIKQRMLKSFAETFGLEILVETGTYYGRMVEAMKGTSNFVRAKRPNLSIAVENDSIRITPTSAIG